ncbi:hypothetical protein M0812_24667 [Anaeramoeba flamelloides]|uniref:Uncharacterized protein n=1 Tax=Anaeramoeba flamelloides TaxID=1746091 RepID=A0AAV7YL12_9EUKA|nr:hypothetical protein M0812_24667 [Anaeramoeba flamelloides]
MSIFTFFATIWDFITKIFHYVFVLFSSSNLLESSSNDSVMVSSDECSTNEEEEEEEEGNSNFLKETEYQKKKLLIQQKQWAVYFNKTIDFDQEYEQKELRNTISQNKPLKHDKESVIQIQNKPTKETKNIENNDLELVEQKHEEQQQQFNKTNKKNNWIRDRKKWNRNFGQIIPKNRKKVNPRILNADLENNAKFRQTVYLDQLTNLLKIKYSQKNVL